MASGGGDKKGSLWNFFTPVKRKQTSTPTTDGQTQEASEPQTKVPALASASQVPPQLSSASQAPTLPCLPPTDIADYMGKQLSDSERFELHKRCWKPPTGYKFPEITEKTQIRRFNREWFNKYPWLRFSDKLGGGVCLYCIVFYHPGRSVGRGSFNAPTTFITKVWNNWKKSEQLSEHNNHGYHKWAETQAVNFFQSVQQGTTVVSQLNSQFAMDQKAKNDYAFKLAQVTAFLGRQTLAFRGDKTSSTFGTKETPPPNPSLNRGNFVELLAFLAEFDPDLDRHLEKMNPRHTYQSPDSQNQMVRNLAGQIRDEILQRVKKAKFWSILADESTDVSSIEQVALLIRYVSLEGGEAAVHEDLLGFTVAKDLTGTGLAKLFVDTMKKYGLNWDLCVGQGYDGASAMRGKNGGVQAIISSSYPLALYYHCASHKFNLAVSKSIENVLRKPAEAINSIVKYFKDSPKRREIFLKHVKAMPNPPKNQAAFVLACATRWVERQEAFSRFQEYFEQFLLALDEIAETSVDPKTASQALAFSRLMTDFNFLLGSLILSETAFLLKSVAVAMQAPKNDLLAIEQIVSALVGTLKQRRNGPHFGKIYAAATAVAASADIRACLPRGKKLNQGQAMGDWFCVNIWEQYIDSLISEIESRFQKEQRLVFRLHALVPGSTAWKKVSEDQLVEAIVFYDDLVGNPSKEAVKAELALWHQHWAQHIGEKPSTALTAFASADPSFWPILSAILHIFSTIPPTTCSAERSFR